MFLAVFDRRKPREVELVSDGAAPRIAAFRRSKTAALAGWYTEPNLAPVRTAILECCIVGALLRILVPSRTLFARVLIVSDCAVAGDGWSAGN
jgi:hypothetical protein